MTEVYLGNRGTGKTLSLAKDAHDALTNNKNVIVIIPNKSMKEAERCAFSEILSEQELNQIRFVSVKEWTRELSMPQQKTNTSNKIDSSSVILIDEAFIILEEFLGISGVEKISMVLSLNDVNMRHLNRDNAETFYTKIIS